MALTKNRLWIGGTAVLAVLLVVAAFFLLIDPKRAEAADLRDEAAMTRTTNAQLESRIEQLKVQFAELPQRQAELAAIRQAMPEEAGLANLVRDLDALAASSGVTLMSLAPGDPVTVTSDAAAAVAAVPAEGETDAPAAAPAADAAAVSSDLLVRVPVTISAVGDFFKAELFLKGVQAEMPRAFLVNELVVQAEEAGAAEGGKPATVNGDVTITITGSVFVLRPAGGTGATAADAAAAGAGPTTN